MVVNIAMSLFTEERSREREGCFCSVLTLPGAKQKDIVEGVDNSHLLSVIQHQLALLIYCKFADRLYFRSCGTSVRLPPPSVATSLVIAHFDFCLIFVVVYL